MKWSGETKEQRVLRDSKWHKWFAWFPLQMSGGTWVWLEHVERRQKYRGPWVYREIGSDWEPYEPHPFGPNAHLCLENNFPKESKK